MESGAIIFVCRNPKPLAESWSATKRYHHGEPDLKPMEASGTQR